MLGHSYSYSVRWTDRERINVVVTISARSSASSSSRSNRRARVKTKRESDRSWKVDFSRADSDLGQPMILHSRFATCRHASCHWLYSMIRWEKELSFVLRRLGREDLWHVFHFDEDLWEALDNERVLIRFPFPVEKAADTCEDRLQIIVTEPLTRPSYLAAIRLPSARA